MKNPTILEGGIARVFSNIRKLFTRENNTDNLIAWVPESDRQLTTKYITKNGIYRASDDGYYAYSSVTVSVSTDSGVTGEGDDGEQHYVAPDPDTGELVDEVIPSRIEITTPPTVTTYPDGASIDLTGAVVTAYLASGEVWVNADYPGGIVPNGEITLVPGTAEYDASQDKHGAPTITPSEEVQEHYNYSEPLNAAVQAQYTEITSQSEETRAYVSVTDGAIIYIVYQSSRYYVAAISESSFTLTVTINAETNTYESQSTAASSYSGKSYHWFGWVELGMENTGDVIKVSPDPQPDWMISGQATPPTMIGDLTFYNSEIIPGVFGSPQTITAEWPRVGDGAVLSDTFDIVATAKGGGGEVGA